MPSNAELTADLALAVSAGELFAVYQPQISIATGATVGVEALCRWRHPRWGLIAPSTFIPIAEESGAIDDLGLFMLSESLLAAEEWRDAGVVREVSVNVSPRQLASEAFFDRVADEFTTRAFAAGALTIEITESSPVVDAGAVLPRLRALRDLGIGISLDDYGTGHASIEQLESLPLTEIKIDGELIRGAKGGALEPLAEIVELAHLRGLRVVAEGIETLAHLDAAVALGCDRAQGFLIGEPQPRSHVRGN